MQNRAPDSLPQARARQRNLRRFDEQASKLVVEPAFYLRWSIRDASGTYGDSSVRLRINAEATKKEEGGEPGVVAP